MSDYFENFARKLAQDTLRRTGELIIEVCNEQIPLLKPALEELQNGTRRYPKSKHNQQEKAVRDSLAEQFPNSQIEVSTPTGRIDLLTSSQVIEVKNVRQYKHAIGQVMSYGHYYPNHEKYIYLFGKVSQKQRKIITQECQTAQIKVVFV